MKDDVFCGCVTFAVQLGYLVDGRWRIVCVLI